MSKKATPTDFSFDALVEQCRRTHEELRSRAIHSVDIAMVVRNWLIGWYIVDYEQTGADRVQYGSHLIERLAATLHIKGSSATNLRKFRQFYREYPIQQTLSVESGKTPSAPLNWQTVSGELFQRFSLSWSHFLVFLPIKYPLTREFYAGICRIEHWDVCTLSQKIGGMLFQSTALLKTFKAVNSAEITNLRERRMTPYTVFRDPCFLGFLELKVSYRERDLESAILHQIESSLPNIGAGFSFVALQKMGALW